MAAKKEDLDVFAKQVVSTALSAESGAALDQEPSEVDKEFEKKILRKVDLWLVGFYSLVCTIRPFSLSLHSLY